MIDEILLTLAFAVITLLPSAVCWVVDHTPTLDEHGLDMLDPEQPEGGDPR